MNPEAHPWGVTVTSDGIEVAVAARHATALSVIVAETPSNHIAYPATQSAALSGTDSQLTASSGDIACWIARLPFSALGHRYALRVAGPWQPASGHRYNSDHLVLDPFATVVDDQPIAGTTWGVLVDQATQTSGLDHATGASAVSSAVSPPICDPNRPGLIYEAHVKGLTKLHPAIPAELQGSYAAVAHPAIIEHLHNLQVTAVELLPICAIADEAHLTASGKHNYWGYSTLNFFAPTSRYATAAAQQAGPGAVCDEVRAMVAALHEAGIEVILDIVFNHTAEGGQSGPTWSFRGVDNALYYRLDGDGHDIDTTGCGGTLDFSEPLVQHLALQSLRHWVTEYGFDGFRFDLAPSLARTGDAFDPAHPFLQSVATDPLLQQVRLIAEPWDVGPNGWQTGQFGPPWAEWNDTFRDSVRRFWVTPGHPDISDLATRIAGSADVFDSQYRSTSAVVNFVTAHDGFTLADLLAYNTKRNTANGEDNRDGTDHNLSHNHGADGHHVPHTIALARDRTYRATLATLLLSRGTPMLLAGDEVSNSQGGNNNPYCLDSPVSWVDWSALDEPDDAHGVRLSRNHTAAIGELMRLRHQLLGQHPVPFDHPLVSWFSATGALMTPEAWVSGTATLVVAWRSPAGQTTGLVAINPTEDSLAVVLNDTLPQSHRLAWDSTLPGSGAPTDPLLITGSFIMPARCVRVLTPL